MMDYIINVRDYSNTYIARGGGMQASCTCGREQAVKRVVEKLFKTSPFKLKKITEETYIASGDKL
ncbi:MAG: hypothetical protein Q8M56_09970 [Desulfobacterales bacterium]|nr:hypothetical protein [Desulfobacterales bacterium]